MARRVLNAALCALLALCSAQNGAGGPLRTHINVALLPDGLLTQVSLDPETGELTFSGFLPELLGAAMERVRNMYELMDPNRTLSYSFTWTSGYNASDSTTVLNDLITNRAQVYAGTVQPSALAMVGLQLKYPSIDPTLPYLTSEAALVSSVTVAPRGLWTFVEPFTLPAWLVIIFCFVAAALLAWLYERFSPYGFKRTGHTPAERHTLGIMTALYGGALALLLRNPSPAKSWSSRFVWVSSFFLAFFITSFYVSRLTTIFAVPNTVAVTTSWQQLTIPGNTFAVEAGSWVERYITNSARSVAAAADGRLNATEIRIGNVTIPFEAQVDLDSLAAAMAPQMIPYKNLSAAIRDVRSGRVQAFVADSIRAGIASTEPPCTSPLVVTSAGLQIWYYNIYANTSALAPPANLARLLTGALLYLGETGLTTRLYTAFLQPEASCNGVMPTGSADSTDLEGALTSGGGLSDLDGVNFVTDLGRQPETWAISSTSPGARPHPGVPAFNISGILSESLPAAEAVLGGSSESETVTTPAATVSTSASPMDAQSLLGIWIVFFSGIAIAWCCLLGEEFTFRRRHRGKWWHCCNEVLGWHGDAFHRKATVLLRKMSNGIGLISAHGHGHGHSQGHTAVTVPLHSHAQGGAAAGHAHAASSAAAHGATKPGSAGGFAPSHPPVAPSEVAPGVAQAAGAKGRVQVVAAGTKPPPAAGGGGGIELTAATAGAPMAAAAAATASAAQPQGQPDFASPSGVVRKKPGGVRFAGDATDAAVGAGAGTAGVAAAAAGAPSAPTSSGAAAAATAAAVSDGRSASDAASQVAAARRGRPSLSVADAAEAGAQAGSGSTAGTGGTAALPSVWTVAPSLGSLLSAKPRRRSRSPTAAPADDE